MPYTPTTADSNAAQPSLAVRVTATNSQGSASATSIEYTVEDAPVVSGISVGALTAFQSSRIRVTTLPGWPAGRTPKEVVTQGTHAHGYVRRSWKAASNDGTWMDFQAGWRKTSAPDVIRIRLDNNSEVDLTYTVNHAVPSGTPRYLDRLATGLNNGQSEANAWTSWETAIAGLADNQVLIVRAKAGGEIYPLSST